MDTLGSFGFPIHLSQWSVATLRPIASIRLLRQKVRRGRLGIERVASLTGCRNCGSMQWPTNDVAVRPQIRYAQQIPPCLTNNVCRTLAPHYYCSLRRGRL